MRLGKPSNRSQEMGWVKGFPVRENRCPRRAIRNLITSDTGQLLLADDVSLRSLTLDGPGPMEDLFLIMKRIYGYGIEKLLNETHFVLRSAHQRLT